MLRSTRKTKKNSTAPTVENLGEDMNEEFTEPTYYSQSPMHTKATPSEHEQRMKEVPLRKTSPEVKNFQNDLNVDQEENGNNVEENTNYNDTIKLGNTFDGFKKWQPSRNFEQLDSDIDDPHFYRTEKKFYARSSNRLH